MATKYIDVGVNPKLEDCASTNTSTVTNKVRVAWDTTISRSELSQTLARLAEIVLNDTLITVA